MAQPDIVRCLRCRRQFERFSGTALHHVADRAKMVAMIPYLVQDISVATVAQALGVSVGRVFDWCGRYRGWVEALDPSGRRVKSIRLGLSSTFVATCPTCGDRGAVATIGSGRMATPSGRKRRQRVRCHPCGRTFALPIGMMAPTAIARGIHRSNRDEPSEACERVCGTFSDITIRTRNSIYRAALARSLPDWTGPSLDDADLALLEYLIGMPQPYGLHTDAVVELLGLDGETIARSLRRLEQHRFIAQRMVNRMYRVQVLPQALASAAMALPPGDG